MGLKDYLKETFEAAKESSGFNESVNKFKKELGIDILKDFEYKENKFYLYVKVPSLSLKTIGGILARNISNIENLGKISKILDSNGNVKYLSDFDSSLILDRETIILYDSKKNKIGKVKEYPFSVGIPLLEKEVKKCEVYLNNKLICKLKKYESFGELEFETLEGDIYIRYNKERPCEFEINKGKKNIGKIYSLPFNLKDKYTDKYVIEYDEIIEEETIVLLVSALDIIL